jgi:hypothetical protein
VKVSFCERVFPYQPADQCFDLSLPCSAIKVFPAQFDTAAPIDAKWHPLSDSHFVVLSKDGIRAFDATTDCSRPCDEWLFPEDLLAHGASARSHQGKQPRPFDPTSFAFGSARGWELLTLFILSTDGSIYSITPILPHGLLLPAGDWYDLTRATATELNAVIAAGSSATSSSSLESGRGNRVGSGRYGQLTAAAPLVEGGAAALASTSSTRRRQALELTYQWLSTCFVDAGVTGRESNAASEHGESALWKRYLPPAALNSSTDSDRSINFARAGPVPAHLLTRLETSSAATFPELVSDALGKPWLPALQGPIAVAPEINAGGENGSTISPYGLAPACDLLVVPASRCSDFSMLTVLFSDGRLCLIGSTSTLQPSWGQAYWPVPSMGPALASTACGSARSSSVQRFHQQHAVHRHTSISSHAASSVVEAGVAPQSSSSSPSWLVLEAVDLRLGHPLQVARAALDSGKGTFVGASKTANGLKVQGFPQLSSLATDIHTGSSSLATTGATTAVVDVVQVPWILPLSSSSSPFDSGSSDADDDNAAGGGSSLFVVSRHSVHLVRFGGLAEMRTLLQRVSTGVVAATTTSGGGGIERIAALARSKTACIEVDVATVAADSGGNLEVAGACIHPSASPSSAGGATTSSDGYDDDSSARQLTTGGASLRLWTLSKGEEIVASATTSSDRVRLPGKMVSLPLLGLVEQAAAMSASTSAMLSLEEHQSGSSTAPSSSFSALTKLPPFSQVMRSREMVEALEKPFTVNNNPSAANVDKSNPSAAALAALRSLSEASTAAVNHALRLHKAQATMQARSAVIYNAAEGNVALAEKVASSLEHLKEEAEQCAFSVEKIQARNAVLVEAAGRFLATLAAQSNQLTTGSDEAFKRQIDGYSAEIARSLRPKVERLRAQLEELKQQRDELQKKRALMAARKAQGLPEEEDVDGTEGELAQRESNALLTPTRGHRRQQLQPRSAAAPLSVITSPLPSMPTHTIADIPAPLVLDVHRSLDTATRAVTQTKTDLLEVQCLMQITEDEVKERMNAIRQEVAAVHYANLDAQAKEESKAIANAAARTPLAATAATSSPVANDRNSLFASFASAGSSNTTTASIIGDFGGGSSPFSAPRTPVVNRH